MSKIDKLKPNALSSISKVALLAPSSRPVNKLEVKRCVQLLKEFGIAPHVGKHVYSSHGYMAGTDEDRLKDLNSAIEDESVDGIFFLRGGYGALRLLPGINYNALKKNPKVIMGSGDSTALLLSINKESGLNVFYGPNMDEWLNSHYSDPIIRTLKIRGIHHNLKFDYNQNPNLSSYNWNLKKFVPCYDRILETVEGELIGGNLSSISSLMGTPYEPDFENKIVFLNDCNERNDILMRWINQLIVSGKLQKAKAVILGQFHNCDSRNGYSMHSVQDMIIERLNQSKVQFLLGYPLNEGGLSTVIPIGIRVRIHSDERRIEFLESACN